MTADRYREFSKSYSRWRFWLIVATGILAAINICAALEFFDIEVYHTNPRAITVPMILNGIAALYAGALTVLGNIENFFNKGEKAAGFRESRDLLLDRYREYCFKWFYYVETHGPTAKACMNAGRLYRQLVDTDQELRQKLKQLTAVEGRTGVEKKPPEAKP